MTPENQQFRKQLIALLRGGQAYMPFDEAVASFPAAHINTRPPNTPYTFWHLLEHLRIAQRDILDYIAGPPTYQPLQWPEGYWPAPDAQADQAAWDRTLTDFRADLNTLIALAENSATDLT
ncbi:MAG: DinB family protein, partial [Anaerolineae bacterium]|nr:DinB family protein [Anaerolineae bacterium]